VNAKGVRSESEHAFMLFAMLKKVSIDDGSAQHIINGLRTAGTILFLFFLIWFSWRAGFAPLPSCSPHRLQERSR
jgi:hypothetical protein